MLKIISARFKSLGKPLGPGWIMNISVEARGIKIVNTPFKARIGEQDVQGLTIASGGDRFEGFLRRVPRQGDRLYVGYGSANMPTQIVYKRGSIG